VCQATITLAPKASPALAISSATRKSLIESIVISRFSPFFTLRISPTVLKAALNSSRSFIVGIPTPLFERCAEPNLTQVPLSLHLLKSFWIPGAIPVGSNTATKMKISPKKILKYCSTDARSSGIKMTKRAPRIGP
jgi:hypothetical protein